MCVSLLPVIRLLCEVVVVRICIAEVHHGCFVIKRHPEITRARLLVDWIDQADVITLKCETTSENESLVSAIVESIREICKLRAEVELLRVDSLPNDGKVIDDIREYD